MANVLVQESSLTAIADAIRAKNGTEDTYKPAEMADAIAAIETGGGGLDLSTLATASVYRSSSGNATNVTLPCDVTKIKAFSFTTIDDRALLYLPGSFSGVLEDDNAYYFPMVCIGRYGSSTAAAYQDTGISGVLADGTGFSFQSNATNTMNWWYGRVSKADPTTIRMYVSVTQPAQGAIPEMTGTYTQIYKNTAVFWYEE